MNQKGQIRDLETLIKGVLTGIIGLVFLNALAPLVSQDFVKTFIEIGMSLIIIAIIISVISLFSRPFRR